MRRRDARPSVSASSTGRQSATMIVQATPRWAVQHASAVVASGVDVSRATTAAVHLLQEDGPAPESIREAPAVLGHRERVVADVIAEVQARVRSGRHAALAHRAGRVHAAGAGQSGTSQCGDAAQASLSGQLEGCAFWNAGCRMQASNAAMVRSSPEKSALKRWPLKICGTRQQSASVGVSP
jgi:hypothetical protein